MSAVVFLSAILIGFLFPNFAQRLVDYLIFYLAVAMTLSVTKIKIDLNFEVKKIFYIFLLNFAFLSGIIILIGLYAKEYACTMCDEGFYIMAVVPPAIAIVPFSRILGGDVKTALIANALLYIFSLVISPIIAHMLEINSYEIFKSLVYLILVPLLVSKIIVRLPFYKNFEKYEEFMVKIMFFLMIYSVIGVSREMLMSKASILLSFLCILRTFVPATVIYVLSKFLKISRGDAVNYTLFSSYKNLGLAIVLSYSIFGKEATFPCIVCVAFEIFLFPYLAFIFRSRL